MSKPWQKHPSPIARDQSVMRQCPECHELYPQGEFALIPQIVRVRSKLGVGVYQHMGLRPVCPKCREKLNKERR